MCVVPSLCWPFPTVLSIPPMLQPSFASPCFSDVCMASWEAAWAFRRAFGTGMHGVVCLCAHTVRNAIYVLIKWLCSWSCAQCS